MRRKTAANEFQNITTKTGKYLDDLRSNLINELRSAAFPTSDKSWNNGLSGKDTIRKLQSTLIENTLKENQKETELKQLLDKTLLEKELDRVPAPVKPQVKVVQPEKSFVIQKTTPLPDKTFTI